MLVVVEVCDVNPAAALDLEELEERFPGVSVIRNPCLSHCATCAVLPYAYVNGEILSHADKDALLREITAAIEKELQDWNSDL